ncbi:branched-chain amino acid ABC transporter permease [Dactylosporangium sp. CA-092794]|uniref:branched-chain amino acid ABC transporter permease n=1 Tax=Dactylosporangium sp. CA-092794 TaxID=3239929 RepID=UPI003D944A77
MTHHAIPLINSDFFHWSFVLQLVSQGLANGSIYALVALTIVIIYRTTGHLNFAQGEMATFGCLLVFTLAEKGGLPYWLAIPAVMAVSFLLGAGIERTLVRPLQSRGGYAVVILTLGLFLVFNSLDAAIWGTQPLRPTTPFPSNADDQFNLIHGDPLFFIRYSTIGVWVTLAVVVALLWFVLERTRLGLAYRAVAANRESAFLVGIPVGRMLALGWGLSAAIGSLAAVLVAQQSGALDFNLMFSIFVYAFAAATLGGLDSTGGAVVGGLIVGLVEALVPQFFSFIGGELSLFMALLIIVIVLLVRPQGLYGAKRMERV